MLGWLHATPEGEKTPRCETEAWPLPDVGAFSYLAEWFIELKLSFGYTDLKAWADLMGAQPEPWEVTELLAMASAYAHATTEYRAKKYDTRPPYDGLTDKSKITAKRLGALFGD